MDRAACIQEAKILIAEAARTEEGLGELPEGAEMTALIATVAGQIYAAQMTIAKLSDLDISIELLKARLPTK
jgi:hypothetical protein